MQVKCKHISANCNPMPNVVDFLDKDTLVFGFSNNLALYSLSQNRILLTIFGTAFLIQTINNNIEELIA